MTYKIRTTRIVVQKKHDSIYGDNVTTVEIEDEGSGEFLKITQSYDASDNVIRIDADEWPTIRKAVDQIAKECKPVKGGGQ